MSVSSTTVKRLFAKSGNKCAFPWCKSPLVVGDLVLGEVCHIRARRKNGPRFEPSLTAKEKDEFKNLLLLCPTHHTEADKNPEKFTVQLLSEIKEIHEHGGENEITPEISRLAEKLFASIASKSKRTIAPSGVKGSSSAVASHGSAAVSITGHNQGNINIRVSGAGGRTRGPKNSIGADANLSGYIDYLCDLYVKYMSPIESNRNTLWARIGKHIKSHFHLARKSRNDLPAEKFEAVVSYIIDKKLTHTPVGKKLLRNGHRLCLSFDEWRNIG